jgi:hippurate hydrolase
MREIVAGIADGYRIDASGDYSHEFIVLSNSKPETNAAVKAAKATVGAPMVDGNCDVAACSEDFAQFLAKVPGCFILMGVGEGAAQLHNPHYDYEDETLVVGASYWVNLTLQQLAQ